MIEILFDNNAFQLFHKRDDYEHYVRKLTKLYNEKKLRIHFNLHNFIEQIEGTDSESAFKWAQKTVNQAGRISNKNFLIPPDLYLQKAIGVASTNEIMEDGEFWMKTFSEFVKLKSLGDFEDFLRQLKDYTIKSKQNIYEGNKDIKKQIELFKRENKIKNFKNYIVKNAGNLGFLQKMFFDVFIEKYKLALGRKLCPSDNAFVKKLVSLCYLSDVYICYNLELSDGRNPKLGDFVDFEQVIYLDCCDYIVTNNTSDYFIWFDNYAFANLANRALTLDMFLELIYSDNFLNTKKAPFDCEATAIN